MIYYIEIFVFFLCCSAFFSSSETALFSLSRIQLHAFRESASHTGQLIVQTLMKPRRILTTILLGNEFVNVSLSIVGATVVAHFSHQSFMVETLISVACITPIIILLGDIVPKNLAFRFAPQFAQFAITPLLFFAKIVAPLRMVLTWIADMCIHVFGGTLIERPMFMEQEYRQLIDLGRREGVIFEEERTLIHNIFEFSDKAVAAIMTPAEKMFALNIALSYEDMLNQLRPEGYSRIPFYEGTRDTIIGILHVRDLFAFDTRHRKGQTQSLREILRPPLFVEPDLKLEVLLREFQQKRMHMALVRKPGKPIEGIVTMHDALVNLFGEIEEE